jgi:hypothetical protein
MFSGDGAIGSDMSKQLPTESQLFSNVDKIWKDIMTVAHEQVGGYWKGSHVNTIV